MKLKDGTDLRMGAVDPWFGHWQKDVAREPNFTKLGGKPPRRRPRRRRVR